MRVYALTKLGRDVTRDPRGGDDETRVLQYLRNNKTGTEDQLEVVGGERWILRRLKGQGLVKELTT